MPPLSEPITVGTSAWVEDAAIADSDWLVTAARAGHSTAWDEIFARLRSDLLRFVRSRGVSDPDDVLQEVMAAAVRQIGEIEGGWSGLRAWVFKVASRRCADFHRLRRSRREVPSDSVPEPLSAGSGADEPFWEESAFREASAALHILTEREREVVTLRVVDELDAAAVASALGVTPVNVRVIQSRALAKLRRYLDNNGGCLDKRFRLFPLPAVAELRHRLGELFPWRFSGGRSPRLRRIINHHATFPSPSPSVVEAGSWPLSGVSQSAAVLLLAAGVGASSFISVPEPPPTPAVPPAPAAVSAPPSPAPATSLPLSSAPELASVPPPQKGLHGQVSTGGIRPPHAGVVAADAAAPPASSLARSAPDDAVTPAPSPLSAGSAVAAAVTDASGQVASGLDDAASTATDVVEGASEALSGMVDDVTDSLDDATGGTLGETTQTVEDTTDEVEDVGGQATDAAEDTVDDATDTAEEVTEEVIDLISDPFGG